MVKTVLIILAVFTVSSISCLAQEIGFETVYDIKGTQFTLNGEASRNVHYISLTGKLGGNGLLTLDGNTCSVNEFGDKDVCTTAFYPPVKVKIEEISSSGTSKLYGIVPTDHVLTNYTVRFAIDTSKPETAKVLLNSAYAPDKIKKSVLMRKMSSQAREASAATTRADKREPKVHVVKMVGLEFVPEEIIISAGDKVVWQCESLTHNAQRDDAPSFCTVPENNPTCVNPCQNNECLLKPSEKSVPIQFNEPGTYDYFCRPHRALGMTGKVIVQ
jgi:plastocyanin